MQLNKLSDRELLTRTQELVHSERELLTKILNHLREIERRRLFSELGYQSLFEYAVKELKYGESQASRRIQAMRLMKEIPQVEEKIASGELSLTNVSQAQSFFRAIAKMEDNVQVTKAEKIKILQTLENKSTREGQQELLKLQPQAALPQERVRTLGEDHSEMRFVMTAELKSKLEEVRTLLGPKGATMNFSELLTFMAEASSTALKAKKFGKKISENPAPPTTPAPQVKAPPIQRSANPRYIPQKLRYFIWQRDQNRCGKCRSTRNLNIDHIRPVALGGKSTPDNLRLLCFHCNQRAAMRSFANGRPLFRPTVQGLKNV